MKTGGFRENLEFASHRVINEDGWNPEFRDEATQMNEFRHFEFLCNETQEAQDAQDSLVPLVFPSPLCRPFCGGHFSSPAPSPGNCTEETREQVEEKHSEAAQGSVGYTFGHSLSRLSRHLLGFRLSLRRLGLLLYRIHIDATLLEFF